MIAYDRTSLDNLKITQHSEKWRQSNLISGKQEKDIRDNHPVDFDTPNFFVRVILFVATYLAISSSLGFIGFLLDIRSEAVGAMLCLVAGLLLYVALEKIIIAQKKYYRAGVDDALLYVALGFVLFGLFLFLEALEIKLELAYYILLALPFSIFAIIRFADKLLTLAAIYGFFSYLFFRLISLGQVGKSILPFVVMVVSFLLFLFSNKLLKSPRNEPWESPLTILKTLSLVAFYLGGNYMVVREMSEMLLGMKIIPGADIPLASVFYGFTIVIPTLYVFLGIKNRDIIFLRIGLLASAFSIFTFRFYFFDFSYELTLTLTGAILFAVGLFALQFLKKPKRGFTAKNLLNLSPDSPQFEALLMVDLSNPDVEMSDEKNLFGGGRSGGAGAEGQY